MFLLVACVTDPIELHPTKPRDSGAVDTADTAVDSGGETGETGGTADTQHTGDTTAGGLSLTVDEDIVTMVHAAWTGGTEATSWVEYRFEGDSWLVAPAIADGDAVLLGIPADTDVEARAAWTSGGETVYTGAERITTGSLPKDLLLPDVSVYEEGLTWDADYAMISIAAGDWTYMAPYWIEIFDRAGRVVWYMEVPDDMMTFYPTISRDGTHIWYEAEDIFGMGSAKPSATRRTLDGRWSETLSLPGMGQAAAEGPDSSFFYEYRTGGKYELRQAFADGTVETVWDCGAYFKTIGVDGHYCEQNTCNWDETRDTVLVSQFLSSTVFEIDVGTGEPIRQFGQMDEGDPWSFDPPSAGFDYQHDPYWTEDGTILVSTHIPGVNGKQMAAEYEVDDATKTLRRIWAYQSDDIWATQVGEAIRLPNDNLIQGYGQDGAVREVTYDGDVVWEVRWEEDNQGDRVVGHTSLIPDLYALNVGPD